jgi:hypothetical protein
MRKNDFFLILGMAVLALVAYFLLRPGSTRSAKTLIVQKDQKVLQRIDLRKVRTDTKLSIECQDGTVIIVYNQDGAKVESSPCPDKVCVKQGRITRPGDSVACVPEKILLTITNAAKENEQDAIIR